MKYKYYPYIWFLQYMKDYKVNYIEFNPYLEMYTDSADTVYVNMSMLGINIDENMNNDLVLSYINLLSLVTHRLLYSPIKIYSDNDYLIGKWEYKSLRCNDRIYILSSCIKDIFKASVIYIQDNMIYIFLDYVDSESNRELIDKILNNFLPIEYDAKYFFEHFCMLNIEELKKLGRWLIL